MNGCNDLDDNPDFSEKFYKPKSNGSIIDSENTPDSYDPYINMELVLDRGCETPEYTRVIKRARENDGFPICQASTNPILDTRLYEVEYLDGFGAHMAANTIAENMFEQVDKEGNKEVLFDEIIDARKLRMKSRNKLNISPHITKAKQHFTTGWDILIKGRFTRWNSLKDVKDSFPIQMAEYALQHGLSKEPEFKWWVPDVIKKQERSIGNMKSKYWICTHNHGIKIPKSVIEALQINAENGNNLWWDAIMLEMKNVRLIFRNYDEPMKNLVGYQRTKCHMIFDTKLGENFRRKVRFMGRGYTTEIPSSIS